MVDAAIVAWRMLQGTKATQPESNSDDTPKPKCDSSNALDPRASNLSSDCLSTRVRLFRLSGAVLKCARYVAGRISRSLSALAVPRLNFPGALVVSSPLLRSALPVSSRLSGAALRIMDHAVDEPEELLLIEEGTAAAARADGSSPLPPPPPPPEQEDPLLELGLGESDPTGPPVGDGAFPPPPRAPRRVPSTAWTVAPVKGAEGGDVAGGEAPAAGLSAPPAALAGAPPALKPLLDADADADRASSPGPAAGDDDFMLEDSMGDVWSRSGLSVTGMGATEEMDVLALDTKNKQVLVVRALLLQKTARPRSRTRNRDVQCRCNPCSTVA